MVSDVNKGVDGAFIEDNLLVTVELGNHRVQFGVQVQLEAVAVRDDAAANFVVAAVPRHKVLPHLLCNHLVIEMLHYVLFQSVRVSL